MEYIVLVVLFTITTCIQQSLEIVLSIVFSSVFPTIRLSLPSVLLSIVNHFGMTLYNPKYALIPTDVSSIIAITEWHYIAHWAYYLIRFKCKPSAANRNIIYRYTTKRQQIPSRKQRPFDVPRQNITRITSRSAVVVQQKAIFWYGYLNPCYDWLCTKVLWDLAEHSSGNVKGHFICSVHYISLHIA